MRQVIVLTHYSHFIRNFIERGMNDDFAISFIEISQNKTTSFLRRIDNNLFTETTYDKVFSKIQSFINRESEVDIRADLRPFLESLYLPHFYIKEFKAYSESNTPFSNLNEKIDAIFMDETVKAKFHEFRTMLNPDSHLFTSSNEEDVRSFAREMMEYLYNFSHNN
jgi:wobble nucleotide-excising tRNase